MYRVLVSVPFLACCLELNSAFGQDVTVSKEAMQIEQAMQNAIREAEPSVATILVSRSEAYRKLFHDQPPEDQPGKLGAFNPSETVRETGPSGNPAKPDQIRERYDLASPNY